MELAKLIEGTGAFVIDNAMANALRDHYHRLGELVRKKCRDPLIAAEVEENPNFAHASVTWQGRSGAPRAMG